MTGFDALALLFTLTAVFAYVNVHALRLPTPIGVMLGGLALSLGLILLGGTAADLARGWLAAMPLDRVLMQGLLAFLLFAGALHVNLDDLRQNGLLILVLATLGVLVSTWLVGSGLHFLAGRLGIALSYPAALLFGALISPTDPIAALGLLRRAGLSKRLEAVITGESLFNDGVGVVVFGLLLAGLLGEHEATGLAGVGGVFLREAVGGVALGVALGLLAFYLLKKTDDYTTEVLITLALVTGGYALAGHLGSSGPLAMVAAGLLIGNHGRTLAMSATTREHLDLFWQMLDEILNALLFVLIGLELLVIPFPKGALSLLALAVVLVLFARAVSAWPSLLLLPAPRRLGGFLVMVWGGLRGGISVALALGLPDLPERPLIVALTYGVVVFSVLVQGLTLGRLAERLARPR